MCLKPLTIFNPAKRQYHHGASRFKVTVPCNDCVECFRRKQLEWSCRAYYEACDTFRQNGFVYFDTLTYDDEHLPHISDIIPFIHDNSVELLSKYNFSCFNRKAPKLFFANLRERLKRSGLDVSNKLSFLLTSEYGEDDKYTHRPHYHVLFFVKSSTINPLDFSLFVNDAWYAGRTDGCPYKPISYVREHIFDASSMLNNTYLVNVLNYVSKYVTKDSVFKFEVEHRIETLLNLYRPSMNDDEFDDYRKQVIRAIKPFNRCSIGFGSSFLDYNDIKDIERTGCIRMPDKDNVFVSVPIPMYLKRKIWYDLIKDVDGTLAWKLNAAGISHNRCYVNQLFENIKQNFRDWYNNLDIYLNFQLSLIPVVKARLHSIDDFSEYIFFYRGRLLSKDNIQQISAGLLPDVPSVEEQIYNDLFNDYDWSWSYLTKRAKKHFGCRFLSNYFSGTAQHSFCKSIDKSTGEFIAYERPSVYTEVVKSDDFVYNQNTLPKWKYFDDIYNIYIRSLRELCKSHDKSSYDTRITNMRINRVYKPLKFSVYV